MADTIHKCRRRPSLRAAWKAASILERRRFVAELLVELLPAAAPPQAPGLPLRSPPAGAATLNDFLCRYVVKSPGDRVQSSALYEGYRRVALSLDQEPISQKAFSTRLSERGYVKRQSSVIWWVGISLVESAAGDVRC